MAFYQTIIGLEIHIELKTKSKMFCGCSANYFGHKPNTHVCPICLGLPGALPAANKKAIEWTVKAGLALNCQIPLFSKFDRKNYFYPDLPKGYQISQYDSPLAVKGHLKVDGKKIGISRVHLEEDTAKMIHARNSTLLDFNRAGVPLMEIVTEPDIQTPEAAKTFLKKLQQIIRYLGISDCDMEKGTMRCEPNISLSKSSDLIKKGLPAYKVEVKNLNSFRFVEKALIYEIKRQTNLLDEGQEPRQETRGWDESKQKTYPQRWKEKAQDYRYFPEPDLPPIKWSKKDIQKLKKTLPELPEQKISRFIKQFNILKQEANLLVSTRKRAQYYEEAVRIGKKHQIDPRQLAKTIINKRVDIDKYLPAELVKILVKKASQPKISDQNLKLAIKQIIEQNPGPVGDYQKGKKTAVEFLLGQLMRQTKGAVNPNQARKLLLEELSQSN